MTNEMKLTGRLSFYLVFFWVLFPACSENRPAGKGSYTGTPTSLAGKKTYLNPVDSMAYTTDGKYEEYLPEGGVKVKDLPVQLLDVVLLTEQKKIPEILSIEELAEIIKAIDTVATKQLSGIKDSGQIILQFTLFAVKKAKVGIAFKGRIKTENLNKLYQKIEAFGVNLRTRKDSFVFQSVYGVNVGRE